MVGSGPVSVDGVLAHVCHVADLVGPEHVALGLDYDFESARRRHADTRSAVLHSRGTFSGRVLDHAAGGDRDARRGA